MQQGIGYGEDIFGNPPSIEHTRLHMIIFSKFTTTIWSIMVHDSIMLLRCRQILLKGRI